MKNVILALALFLQSITSFAHAPNVEDRIQRKVLQEGATVLQTAQKRAVLIHWRDKGTTIMCVSPHRTVTDSMYIDENFFLRYAAPVVPAYCIDGNIVLHYPQ
jgi:uncharacterized membrane protein